MGPTDTQDAGFFTLVHRLRHKPPAEAVGDSDRRTNDRRSFNGTQRMATYIGGRVPGPDEFRPIECYDLSPSGFSFLSDRLPEANSLVVSLGDAATFETLLTADVVTVAPAPAGAQTRYRIGCRFTGRVNRTASMVGA